METTKKCDCDLDYGRGHDGDCPELEGSLLCASPRVCELADAWAALIKDRKLHASVLRTTMGAGDGVPWVLERELDELELATRSSPLRKVVC